MPFDMDQYEQDLKHGETGDVVVVKLSDYARRTIDEIRRMYEDDEQVIVRILETLLATSPDFDVFFGEPQDGSVAAVL